jgi:hypothetical protein
MCFYIGDIVLYGETVSNVEAMVNATWILRSRLFYFVFYFLKYQSRVVEF